jgi:hypothetical protein
MGREVGRRLFTRAVNDLGINAELAQAARD